MNLGALVKLGAATAVVGVAATWAFPGSSPYTLAVDALSLLTGSIPLTEAQLANVRIIADEFTRAGLGRWQLAAVVNAYAESRLNERARFISPTEDSVGLFQLNSAGAGAGMSVEDREDPRLNTRRIIEEARRRGIASTFPRTEGDAVAWFAREVERCSACGHQDGDAQLFTRQGYADRLFGAGTSARPFGAVRVA